MQPAASFKVTGYGECMDVPLSSSIEPGAHNRSKIIENLAVVNYDTNNLYLAPYDWRLSCWNLEERDGYFSKLQSTIEGLKYGRLLQRWIYCSPPEYRKRQKRKTVLAAHSMGSTVCHEIIGVFLPLG